MTDVFYKIIIIIIDFISGLVDGGFQDNIGTTDETFGFNLLKWASKITQNRQYWCYWIAYMRLPNGIP